MKKISFCFLLVLVIEIICFPSVSFASESIKPDFLNVSSDRIVLGNKDKIIDPNIEFNELALESNIEKNYSVSSEADGSFSIKNKKGLYTAAFKPKSGNGLLSFSQGNANLLISPLNPGSVSGSVYNNTITYENIYPDTSIRYTLEKNRLKEDIIIQKYTGMSDFFFQLNMNNAEYEKQSSGEISFFDTNTSEQLFYMANPYAVDMNGNCCNLVTLEFTKKGLLKLTVDPEWLNKAVYPVKIDPTIYLPDIRFTRPSIAYKQDGTQVSTNQPRYEASKFGQAVMVEQGTTNLFEQNQLSKLYSYPSNTYATKQSNGYWRIYKGSDNEYLCNYTIDIVNGTTYTESFYFYHDGTINGFYITFYTNNGHHLVPAIIDDLGGGLKRASATYTTVANDNYIRAIDFYTQGTWTYIEIVRAQLEAKNYASSYQINGIARADESLTIPTGGIINKDKGAIEVRLKPLTIQNWNSYFGMDTSNGRFLLFFDNTGRVLWDYGAINDSIHSAAGVAVADQSIDVCMSWDATVGTRELMVNGQSLGKKAFTAPMNLPTEVGLVNNFATFVDDLRISNRARTLVEHQAAFQSNQPLPVDVDTTLKMNFDNSLQISKFVYSSSDTAKFTRPSIAYKQDGTQVSTNQPRYEASKFGQAVMVEQGTTNLFEQNQLSKLYSYPSNTYATKQSNGYWRIYKGSDNEYLCNYTIDIVNGTTYTESFYFYHDGTINGFYITFYTNNGHHLVPAIIDDLGGGLKRASATYTTVANDNYIRAIDFYTQGTWTYIEIVRAQLEAKNYASSYQINGIARADESLTIPTGGIINKDKGAIEVRLKPLTIQNWNSYFGMDTSNGRFLLFFDNTGRVLWDYGAINDSIHSAAGVAVADQSIDVCMSWDATVGTRELMVNGQSIGKKAFTAAMNLPNEVGLVNNFATFVDDLRISNRARTLVEHQAAFQSNQPLPIDVDTTLKMNFDNNSGVSLPMINYVYDNLNYLNSITTPNKTINYQYDGNGNLIRRIIN